MGVTPLSAVVLAVAAVPVVFLPSVTPLPQLQPALLLLGIVAELLQAGEQVEQR